MTQQEHDIGYNVEITESDLTDKNLNINNGCFVRCHKLQFLNSSKVHRHIDSLKEDKLEEITDNLKKVIEDGTCD